MSLIGQYRTCQTFGLQSIGASSQLRALNLENSAEHIDLTPQHQELKLVFTVVEAERRSELGSVVGYQLCRSVEIGAHSVVA